MIGWTLKWTIMSLVLIILIHYLYIFFIETLTVPKVKDLVNKPTQRYNEILTDITNNSNANLNNSNATNNNINPNIDEMHDELRDFLSNIKTNNSNNNLEPMSSNNDYNYSSF